MPIASTDSPNGFDRLGLDSSILRGVRAAGFIEPRPIQVETIPAALAGRDVLGLAQTGTGKTAAFALPLLHRLAGEQRRGPRVLVLAPTRELATQIDAEIRTLARFTQVRAVTVFGGASANGQIKALRKNPEIVVGCPGRILDLMGRGALRLGGVESVVLDEADHMFDMGFLPDLRRILKALPTKRQNLLFSATMPREIRSLADGLLKDPKVVELSHSSPATTIDHALVPVREDRKRDLLERILAEDACSSAIVFTRTKHRARRLAQQLDKAGHRAVGLQGNMSQPQRDRAMQGFRKRLFDVLVATDIAARGIDVQGVSHVINFDVPGTPDAYTHRIGRTGRAELEGRALTFVTRNDSAWLRATERQLGNPIARRPVEGFEGESIDSGNGGAPAGRSGRHGANARPRSGDASRRGGRGKRRPGRNSSRRRQRQA
ncbi:MAG: DEAD/DEAH box helicase [Deltaproteobacteria bacterium]|nr:DEAD/DEAH box helicase [Deltaproteobacteria bacterium]